jgi:uncharacterized protein (TIGR02001 family)
MLTSVRSLMAATILAGSAFAAAPAFAQDDIGVEVSANAAVVSEYRFRGVDLSGGDIAIQGGIDLGLPAGFYVGTWGSSLDEDTVGYGHTELDLYGGWATDLSDTVSFDVGVIAYLYPNAGPGDFDYIELYSSVGVGVGPADLTLGVAYAPDQDSLGSTDNFYVYSDVGFGIPNTPVTLNGHLGYTDGYLTYTNNSKAWDWSLGADVALGETLSIGVAYVGAEGRELTPNFGYEFTKDTVVVSLSASF